MALEIEGKITDIKGKIDGTSKAGNTWSKQEFIVKTNDEFPKDICIGLMGDKIKELNNFNKGDTVKVSLNIESREYQGKWYTNVSAWRIEALGKVEDNKEVNDSNDTDKVENSAKKFPVIPPANDSSDDLPF